MTCDYDNYQQRNIVKPPEFLKAVQKLVVYLPLLKFKYDEQVYLICKNSIVSIKKN